MGAKQPNLKLNSEKQEQSFGRGHITLAAICRLAMLARLVLSGMPSLTVCLYLYTFVHTGVDCKKLRRLAPPGCHRATRLPVIVLHSAPMEGDMIAYASRISRLIHKKP